MKRLLRSAGGFWIGALCFLLTDAVIVAFPAHAQFSGGYAFLKAVKDRDGAKAKAALDVPGSTIVDTRDPSSGDTPLILTTRRRDLPWMAFMLQYGAKTEMRANDGETALTAAARIDYLEGAQLLLNVGAAPNLANTKGETPLIIAVQARDPELVRILLAAGADPKISDNVTGMSARDYAARDARSAAILRMLDQAKPRPDPKTIAGPPR